MARRARDGPAYLRVPTPLIDSGDLPREAAGTYLYLARFAMGLGRERRNGDRFTADKSKLALALSCGNWRNAEKLLERATKLAPDVIRYHVRGHRVEISLPGFDDAQGWNRAARPGAGSGAGSRAGSGAASGAGSRAGSGTRPGADRGSSARNSDDSRENVSPPRYQTPDTRLQTGDGLTPADPEPEGEAYPEILPDPVREAALRAPRFLHPSVQQLLEALRPDEVDGYLRDEWHRFREYRLAHGPADPNRVDALFCRWLKDPQTGERAHERLKVLTNEVANRLTVVKDLAK